MKTKHLIWGLLSVAVVVSVAGLHYVYQTYKIRGVGIEVTPTQAHVYEGELTPFMQTDEQWAEDRLGNSPYTLAEEGCVVTVVSSVLESFGFDTDPQQLNLQLTEAGAYTKQGELLWYRLEELFPGVEYHYERVFDEDDLKSDLEDGGYPLVKVKYSGNGEWHWVAIVGSDESEFWVLDPLAPEGVVALREHGRVYAYRILSYK